MNRALIHRRAQRVLPAGIQTCGLLGFGLAPGQAESTVLGSAFGRETRGVVVLRLSGTTALAVQRHGPAFFEQSDVARAGLQHAPPARYGRWRRVALAGADGLPAAGDPPAGRVMVDQASAGCRTGYFAIAQDERGWLLVLPVERLVMYGWRDRSGMRRR